MLDAQFNYYGVNIFTDGRQGNMRFFCMAHMRKKRVALMILLSFIGILTLVVMFTIYAAFRGLKIQKFGLKNLKKHIYI